MNRRIRLLSLIEDLSFGGDQARLLAFARTIDRNRFEHIVATIRPPAPGRDAAYGTMHQQYADAGVEVVNLGERRRNLNTPFPRPARMAYTAIFLLRVALRLRRFIHQQGIDLVDAHLNVANLVSVLAGRMTRTPAVVTLYHVTHYIKETRLHSLGRRLALARASAIITDSRARCHDIRSQVGGSHPPIAMIPNGVFPPASTRTRGDLRRALGLPDDPTIRVIGQVSGLTPFKGHMVLLRAARLVVAKEPRTHFLCVGYERGNNSYKAHLGKEVADLGLSKHVHITGYPGSIGDVWQTIDIHAHASLFDSLPNAIIESMSLAKPAVVTSVGGVPEIAEHQKTALVVPPGDPHALAQALLQLLREPETAQRLGEAARKRYEERYRPETMTGRLQDLFCEILG
ncbi:MAG: glycosyltransferase [Candidatus Entotheonellia bacterium]